MNDIDEKKAIAAGITLYTLSFLYDIGLLPAGIVIENGSITGYEKNTEGGTVESGDSNS